MDTCSEKEEGKVAQVLNDDDFQIPDLYPDLLVRDLKVWIRCTSRNVAFIPIEASVTSKLDLNHLICNKTNIYVLYLVL